MTTTLAAYSHERLVRALTYRCDVCNGFSPSWEKHDVNPPCRTTAEDELNRRALAYTKLRRYANAMDELITQVENDERGHEFRLMERKEAVKRLRELQRTYGVLNDKP